MRNNYYLSLVLLGVTLFSCTNESTNEFTSDKKKIELTKNEVLSIAWDDAKELSDKDLLDIVGSFSAMENNGTTRSNATSLKITKRTYINKEGEFDKQALASRAAHAKDDIISEICEVEFNNKTAKGKAVVATNAQLPSVLAYIPNIGNESVMEQSGANELLHASKASYLYRVTKTKELVDSLKLPTLQKISKELQIPINEITYDKIKDYIVLTDASNASTRVTAVQGQPAGIAKLSSSIDPYIKTNWGQDEPYNGCFSWDEKKVDWVRTGSNGKTKKAVPVGCVNVAIAQLMGYTHLRVYHPLIFHFPGAPATHTFQPDFFRMTAKPTIQEVPGAGADHIKYLMFDLYDINKTTSQKAQDGAVIGSEVSEENMLNTMNKYFKYNPKSAFNGDQVWASLRNKNPILMLTKDHAFIISGILITEKSSQTRQLVKTNDVYWHANFGWADAATGYYQLDHNANTYFEANGTKEWCYKNDCIKNIRAID